MTYFSALCDAMAMLAKHPKSLFLGQAVTYPGTAMHNTLTHLPAHKLMEMPVAEEMQLGMSTGLALQGHLPISIFPRINFLLLAANQLVNHLDKIPLYSDYRPKVIIRTAVASDKPMDPGPQHLGNYADALQYMLEKVRVVMLDIEADIMPTYQEAMADDGYSYLIVERMSRYGEP